MSWKACFTVAVKAIGLGGAMLTVLWILSLTWTKGDMVPEIAQRPTKVQSPPRACPQPRH